MSEQEAFRQISEYLRQKNHSEKEIGRILSRLHEYELDTMVDAIMDSIASGETNLHGLIDEVLRERQA